MKCFNTDVQLQLDSHVWPSRLNQVFLVTEFIYEKTDLFRNISVYITAEVFLDMSLAVVKQTD
jgi:hypothetical protein